MSKVFHGPVAAELQGFLQFKRGLGYGYLRGEFTLREFDRFSIEYTASNDSWQLDRAAVAWLASEEACYITGADIPVDGGLGLGA